MTATDAGRVEATLLGTGTSTGVPVIGCTCRVCRSSDPRDRRTRCSCLVRANGVSILIDAGPDFRSQALREHIDAVDAVLFTHHHFDHVVGIDDLKPFLFRNRAPIPCYALPDTEAVLRRMFAYIFEDGSYPGVPNLTLHALEDPQVIHARDDRSRTVTVHPLTLRHGDLAVAGYRIGGFAYLTDTNHIPARAFRRLAGLDVLVLDALRHAPHAAHFSIAEAVEAARRIGAGRTWFVHMTHSVLHAEEDARLPEGVRLGYDGLRMSARLDAPGA